jgi:hypothetical protein
LEKDNSRNSTSFQAVTIINPEVTVESSDSEQRETASTLEPGRSVSADGSGVAERTDSMGGGIEGTGSIAGAGGDGDMVEWIPAVFVFGGMDTYGNVHGDSFILVP